MNLYALKCNSGYIRLKENHLLTDVPIEKASVFSKDNLSLMEETFMKLNTENVPGLHKVVLELHERRWSEELDK